MLIETGSLRFSFDEASKQVQGHRQVHQTVARLAKWNVGEAYKKFFIAKIYVVSKSSVGSLCHFAKPLFFAISAAVKLDMVQVELPEGEAAIRAFRQ